MKVLLLVLSSATLLLLAGCPTSNKPACNATSCTGCCDSTGTCVSGVTSNACGSSGTACAACGSNQTCLNGTCQTQQQQGSCGPSNCMSGCCAHNQCINPPTAAACGSGGGACVPCAGGLVCQAGNCVSTGGCDSTNCGGCCTTAGQCITAETVSQCGNGTAGSLCAPCGAN